MAFLNKKITVHPFKKNERERERERERGREKAD